MPGIVQPASTTVLQHHLQPGLHHHHLLPPGLAHHGPAQVPGENVVTAVGHQGSKLSSGDLGSKISSVGQAAPLSLQAGAGQEVVSDPGLKPYTGILFPLLAEKQAPESATESATEPCCENQTSNTIVLDTEDNAVDNTVDSTELEDNSIADSSPEVVSGDGDVV